MNADQAVYEAIKNLAPTYPDVAPESAPVPRVVYQQVGGPEVVFQESSDPGVDTGRIQVTVWARSRLAAANLSKLIKSTLRQAPIIQVTPVGARIAVYEKDTQLYGSRQDFMVWSPD